MVLFLVGPVPCSMSLDKNPSRLTVKVLLLLWGILSMAQGAALGFFVSGSDDYSDSYFIELVYCTVLVSALISFFSARTAALLSLAATAGSLTILFASSSLTSNPVIKKSLLLAVANRPFLAAVALILCACFEPRKASQEIAKPN